MDQPGITKKRSINANSGQYSLIATSTEREDERNFANRNAS